MLSATCKARIDLLHKPMRTPILLAVQIAEQTLESAEPKRWKVRVAETYRSATRQWDLYKQGRELQPDGTWLRAQGPDGKMLPIVTNARPDESPHCTVEKGGQPAAMAADLWIVDATSGALAPDGDIVWAVIACAAYRSAPTLFASGGFFSTIKGGDFPHVELRGWRQFVKNGVVK